MQFYKIITDDTLRETISHGTIEYPFAYYIDDIQKFDLGYIDWHWHKEVEFMVVSHGTVDCLIEKNRITIQKGWGIFLNSETIHRFESKDNGTMPNIVFSPELIAAENSLIHKTYIAPLLLFGKSYQILNPNIVWQNKILILLNQLFDIQQSTIPSLIPLNTLILISQLWKHLFQNMSTEFIIANTEKKLFNLHNYKLCFNLFMITMQKIFD